MTIPAPPPRKRAGGRPPFNWTPELEAELLDRISHGETLAQLSRDPHMPAQMTVWERRVADPAFAVAYAHARDAQLEAWEDELIDIAENGRNDWMEREARSGRMERVLDREHFERSRLRIDAKKWIMSKRAPQRYGDALRLDGDMGPRAIIAPEPLSPAAWAEKYGGKIIEAVAIRKPVEGAIGRLDEDEADEAEAFKPDPGLRKIA